MRIKSSLKEKKQCSSKRIVPRTGIQFLKTLGMQRSKRICSTMRIKIKSIKVDPELKQMLDLADKDINTVIIIIFQMFKKLE